MDVQDFAEIKEEFDRRVQRIVWCSVATVDRKGRPRSRILHPIWEGTTGYIATGPDTLKAKHLAANPYVSLSYWDPKHEQVHVDARAEWVTDAADRRRIWELFKATPEPYGYDPAMIWKDGPDSPAFGVLKLTPWRIEVWALKDMVTGAESKVWRA